MEFRVRSGGKRRMRSKNIADNGMTATIYESPILKRNFFFCLFQRRPRNNPRHIFHQFQFINEGKKKQFSDEWIEILDGSSFLGLNFFKMKLLNLVKS